jgi:hypothetical protein
LFIEFRLPVQKWVEYAESLLRFFDRLGGVTGKSEPLVQGNSQVFYLSGPWNGTLLSDPTRIKKTKCTHLIFLHSKEIFAFAFLFVLIFRSLNFLFSNFLSSVICQEWLVVYNKRKTIENNLFVFTRPNLNIIYGILLFWVFQNFVIFFVSLKIYNNIQ